MPKFNCCSVISIFCCRNSQKAKIYNAGKNMLKKELNIGHMIKKIRTFELYLEVMLKPFQRSLLQAMTKRVDLDPKKSPSETTKQESLKECLNSLMEVQQSKKLSYFNKRLASHLGLELP